MIHEELNLDQLLADPLIRMVMSSDAVQEADIRSLAGRLSLRKAEPAGRTEWIEVLRPARPTYRMPPHHTLADSTAAQACFA